MLNAFAEKVKRREYQESGCDMVEILENRNFKEMHH